MTTSRLPSPLARPWTVARNITIVTAVIVESVVDELIDKARGI